MTWGGLLLLVLVSAPAWAADVELLHAEPVWADGETGTRLELLVPGIAPEDSVQIKGRKVLVRDVYVPGPGIVRFEVVPRAVERAGTAELFLSVKGGVQIEEKVTVELLPPTHGSLAVEAAPAELVHGQGGASIQVAPVGAHRLSVGDRPLLATAQLGSIQGPAPLDEGWLGRYEPPTRLGGPATDLVLLTDPSAGGEAVGMVAVPLLVTHRRTFETSWGSQNVLTVGERTYGPTPADAGGRVSFDVHLDPAHPTGTLEAVAEGSRKTTSDVTIHPGATREIAFFPVPAGVPVGRVLSLHLAAVHPGGAPWEEAPLVLKSGGAFENLGGGLYRVQYTAPSRPGPWVVEATAGDRTARITVNVVADLPLLALSSDATELSEGLEDLRIQARVTDSQGTALKNKVKLVVSGAQVISGPKSLATGLTDWWLRPGGSVSRVIAEAEPFLPPSKMSASRVLIWPTVHALQPGRVGGIRVAAVDPYGLPVPGEAVEVTILAGDAEVHPTLKTGKDGTQTVIVRPGTEPGPVVIQASIGGIHAHTTLWLTDDMAPRPQPTGSPEVVALNDTWQALFPRLTINRPDAAPEVAVAVQEESGPSFAAALEWLRTGVPEEEEEVAPPPVPVEAPLAAESVAAPEATAPVAAAPVPKTPRKKPTGPSFGLLEVQTMDLGWSQTLASESAGVFPSEEGFGTESPDHSLGLSARAELWPRKGSYGLAVRWRGSTRPTVDEEVVTAGRPGSMSIGLRWRHSAKGPFRLEAGLGGHRSDVLIFRYADEAQTRLHLLDVPIWGVRVSGAAGWDYYRWRFRLEGGETLAGTGFWPVDTWAGVRLDIPLNVLLPGTYISARADLDWRTMEFESNDSTASMQDRQQALAIGIGTLF